MITAAIFAAWLIGGTLAASIIGRGIRIADEQQRTQRDHGLAA